MNLSELSNETTAYITKVNGDGTFRKRINEMGFIPGVAIKPIKKAPLQDPVEYELMGYRISLRCNEAKLIEITLDKEELSCPINQGMIASKDYAVKDNADTNVIRVAMVGNPNCGKTTLFNQATGSHERVGNYSGVTVGMKSTKIFHGGHFIELIDLPGTYSLSEYSSEEVYVRECLSDSSIDMVINIIDSSNIERNLFLSTQLIDMNISTIIALNMFDELERSGNKFNHKELGEMLGIPIVPTTASRGDGITTLLDKVIEQYSLKKGSTRHFHINYGKDINHALEHIKVQIKRNEELRGKFHTQYLAIKLLERDSKMIALVEKYEGAEDILKVANEEADKIERYYNETSNAVVANSRYSFIRGALKETFTENTETNWQGYKADKVMTNRWLGMPLFLLILGLIFELTFTVGSYPQEWIEGGINALSGFVQSILPDGILTDLVVDGIIAGVGGVLLFFPNIIILFAFISLLEDSGYMARAAFIVDKLMHKIGLHGKSFIPMLMGFGCNVPAVMATRTLENKKDRITTMLIVPFMSCSARLPVYLLLVSAFFDSFNALILLGVYITGIIIAIISALILKSTVLKGNEAPFVMELPPYRIPTMRNTLRHTWGRSKEYLAKMGGVILVTSVLIWALGYFPRHEVIDTETGQTTYVGSEIEESYLAGVGRVIEPALSPLGYDWKMGVALVSGIAAKEVIVSTVSVLYPLPEHKASDPRNLKEVLRFHGESPTKGTIVSLLIFILLYTPCFAVITAISKEAGRRWALFSFAYSTTIAWICAYVISLISKIF